MNYNLIEVSNFPVLVFDCVIFFWNAVHICTLDIRHLPHTRKRNCTKITFIIYFEQKTANRRRVCVCLGVCALMRNEQLDNSFVLFFSLASAQMRFAARVNIVFSYVLACAVFLFRCGWNDSLWFGWIIFRCIFFQHRVFCFVAQKRVFLFLWCFFVYYRATDFFPVVLIFTYISQNYMHSVVWSECNWPLLFTRRIGRTTWMFFLFTLRNNIQNIRLHWSLISAECFILVRNLFQFSCDVSFKFVLHSFSLQLLFEFMTIFFFFHLFFTWIFPVRVGVLLLFVLFIQLAADFKREKLSFAFTCCLLFTGFSDTFH